MSTIQEGKVMLNEKFGQLGKMKLRAAADNAEQKRCPECESTKLVRVYERAELVCTGCGFVVHDKIMDMGPEWRAFDQEQRGHRDRAGAPMTWTIHDKGLSTMIDWQNRDTRGRELTPKRRAQIYRLRKWQQRTRVSGGIERNLALALSEIDRMSSHLGLSRNVRETAAMTYRRAVEEKLIRGRSIEGIAAAALYAACRECKVPRTLDEIAGVSRIRKKEIGRTYRFIARELSIHPYLTSPTDYIPRFGSELGLSGETQSKAIDLIKDATEKGLISGRGPIGVAAAAIYIAGMLRGERRTQRNVADVAQITEVTVRNRYKNMCEKLGLKVEP